MSKLTKPSEGFFLAKRQVQDSLSGRVEVLNEKLEKLRTEGNYTGIALVLVEIEVVEKVRNHLRNSMLWDTEKGL